MSRRNPFDEIERMFERMGRQFDQAAGELGGEVGPSLGRSVRVDLRDRGDAFVLTADLPGFDTDEIDLTLVGDSVRIEASRDAAVETEEVGTYLRRERRRESVSRTVGLPDPVDEDAVRAEFDNGVLTVTLPKRGGDESGHAIDIT